MTNEIQKMDAAEILQPTALEALNRGEVDMMIVTAKKYPRDIARIKQKIEQLATLDEETAEMCFYAIPRDGKTIEGPSVRLAEIALTCYTNIKAGFRPMSNDGKKVTAQGVCYDLENNVSISVEKSRKITRKDGSPFSEDMQITTMNAIGAIVFRDAVFKVIPQVLIKPAMEKAKQVALGNVESLSKKREAIMQRLKKFCPDEKRILAVIHKEKADQIEPTDLLKLMGLATALKDGEITVEDAFPMLGKRDEPKGAEALATKLASKSVDVTPAPVAVDRDKLIAEIDKASATKLAKVQDVLKIKWQDGEDWKQASNEVLQDMIRLLKA